MSTFRDLIIRSMKEGCAIRVHEIATPKELEIAQKTKKPSKLELFFNNATQALSNLGWKECEPSAAIKKAYHHLKNARFFRYEDRLALLFTFEDFRTIESNTVAVFEIVSTIYYEIKKATDEDYGLSLYRWDVTTKKAKEALIKCGWVVTTPNKKIANTYSEVNNAIFFEKGDMFAVTGVQNIPTTTLNGNTITREALIIINYKKKFND